MIQLVEVFAVLAGAESGLADAFQEGLEGGDAGCDDYDVRFDAVIEGSFA